SPAADVAGPAPSGDALSIGLAAPDGPDTLVAFLSSGCGTCAAFWPSMATDAGEGALTGVRLVAVTRDPAEESPAAVAALAPSGATVVMSSRAWEDYRVPGSPYFSYVKAGRVVGEGTARTWAQLLSLCARARADGALTGADAPAGRDGPSGPAPWGDAEREARADAELLAAGIHPGHPSLHPPAREPR
ncbi:MAG TPA: hypothetical protein VFH45_03415, partial [Acidimicrobiales bacterium]|nr:hypothetical protein [Acidimicrobiales bacterium]